MYKLLCCDIARKAGSFVCLCYNMDSGNPARRNSMKRRFPASDSFVCLLQSACHLWRTGKRVPVVMEPRMWTCLCVWLGLAPSSELCTRQGCASGAPLIHHGCWRMWHSVLWSTGQPCPWVLSWHWGSGVHTNTNIFLTSDFASCTIAPDKRADLK